MQLEWWDLHTQLCCQLRHELVSHHVDVHIGHAVHRGSLETVWPEETPPHITSPSLLSHMIVTSRDVTVHTNKH